MAGAGKLNRSRYLHTFTFTMTGAHQYDRVYEYSLFIYEEKDTVPIIKLFRSDRSKKTNQIVATMTFEMTGAKRKTKLSPESPIKCDKFIHHIDF